MDDPSPPFLGTELPESEFLDSTDHPDLWPELKGLIDSHPDPREKQILVAWTEQIDKYGLNYEVAMFAVPSVRRGTPLLRAVDSAMTEWDF